MSIRNKQVKLPITPFFCFSYDALEIVHSVQNEMLRMNQHPKLSNYWAPQSWTIVGHACTKGELRGIQDIFDNYIKKSDCVIFVIVNRIGKYLKGEWKLSSNEKKDVHILYLPSEDIDMFEKIKRHFKGVEKYASVTTFSSISDITKYCLIEILLPVLEKIRDQDRRAIQRKNVSAKTIETIKRRSKDISSLLGALRIPQAESVRADFASIHNIASLTVPQGVHIARIRNNMLKQGPLKVSIKTFDHEICFPKSK